MTMILVLSFLQIYFSNPDFMQKLKNKELGCFFACVASFFLIVCACAWFIYFFYPLNF